MQNPVTMRIAPDLERGKEYSPVDFHALDGPGRRPWGHDMLEEIHDKMGFKGSRTAIAVIDDGCQLDHENFTDADGNSRIIHTSSHVRGERPDTGADHGTHVTGTAAGRFTGVAPEAKIIVLKGLNRNGSGSSDDLTDCGQELNDLVRNGKIKQRIVVANMSFGGPWYQPQEDQLQEAESLLITNVAAAGNSGGSGNRPTCGHPGTTQFGITVAALDQQWEPTKFSSRCKQVDIGAPGHNVLSSIVGGRYGVNAGTSMASPYVAGAAALIMEWQLVSGFAVTNTAQEWSEFFRANAKDIGRPGRDVDTGHGMFDFIKLLDAMAKGKLRWK